MSDESLCGRYTEWTPVAWTIKYRIYGFNDFSAGRVHISEVTKRALDREGSFITELRGPVNVKVSALRLPSSDDRWRQQAAKCRTMSPDSVRRTWFRGVRHVHYLSHYVLYSAWYALLNDALQGESLAKKRPPLKSAVPRLPNSSAGKNTSHARTTGALHNS